MPELPLGFFEHAKWQQIGPQNKRLAGLDWWCNHLKGASLKPLLATDFARSGRPNIGQNPGGIVKVRQATIRARYQLYICYSCGPYTAAHVKVPSPYHLAVLLQSYDFQHMPCLLSCPIEA